MLRLIFRFGGFGAIGWCAVSPCLAIAAEAYLPEPVPPGFRAVATELDGPVFSDSQGRTMYRWPLKELRNGYAGDTKGNSTCDDAKTLESDGLMSPYPPGLLMPELATRPACAEMWPPVSAPDSAKPIGKWTTITRKYGVKQWAYDGYPLYTCRFDRARGDVLGGTSHEWLFDGPAVRQPVGPSPSVPPGFVVTTTPRGRLLQTSTHFSVYASDGDADGRSRCDASCAKIWPPVLASELAHSSGEWSVVERSSGVKQWAFRKQPLYTYSLDHGPRSQDGSDVSGWHNVYTQAAPPPPPGFTVQDTESGQVLADSRGMTIYTYRCGDDALDQLSCDHPSTTQVYRLAMCGGGDAARCLRDFPYVPAPADGHSGSRSWSVVHIDAKSGAFVARNALGALHVWAFRDRPVYTYAGDTKPGDINADAHGEFRSEREGFLAFWLRDDFFHRTY